MVSFQRKPFILDERVETFLEEVSTALAGTADGKSPNLSLVPSPGGLEDVWPTRPTVFGNPVDLPYWVMSSANEAVAVCPIPGVFGMIILEDETFLIYTTGGWTIACLGPEVENVGIVFCPIDGEGDSRVKLHLAKVQLGKRPNEAYYHVL